MISDDVNGGSGEAELRDYRLAEFLSGLASAVDVLREAVEEMKGRDGITEAGEYSFDAAKSAIAALASAEMSYYEDEGVSPETFADYYHAIGEPPPDGARAFSAFRAPAGH